MSGTVGQNTPAGELLRSFVERVERIRAEKKQLAQDEASVMAEAKAQGFNPPTIRAVLKRRAAKPHDVQEADALLDIYLHAMGMAVEPPLFRFTGLAGADATAREQVMERMREFVPPSGEGSIVVNWGGRSFRLERRKDGTVAEQEVLEQPQAPRPERPSRTPDKPPPPDVDDAGAEALGRECARDNRPVIDNPFPFGDPRRARFDEGWRREAGSDGMGPEN